MVFRYSFRLWYRNVFSANQIPVSAVNPLTTFQYVIISSGCNTFRLNEFSIISIATDVNHFNPIKCLCTSTTGLSNSDTGTATGITFNHQTICFRIVTTCFCLEENKSISASVIPSDSQYITRHICSEIDYTTIAQISCNAPKPGEFALLFNNDLVTAEHHR